MKIWSFSLFPSYGMRYHGQMALQIALLVAFTQLIPEHQVQFFGVIKARVKVRNTTITIIDSTAKPLNRLYQWPTWRCPQYYAFLVFNAHGSSSNSAGLWVGYTSAFTRKILETLPEVLIRTGIGAKPSLWFPGSLPSCSMFRFPK